MMSASYHHAVVLSLCHMAATHVSVTRVVTMPNDVLYLASELTYDMGT